MNSYWFFLGDGVIMGKTHCSAHSLVLTYCDLSLQNNLLSPDRITDRNGPMQQLSYFLLQHLRVK